MTENEQFVMDTLVKLTNHLETAFAMIEDLQVQVSVLEFREEMRGTYGD